MSSYHLIFYFIVETRAERPEHIIMGTSGTVLDWILKKKVNQSSNLHVGSHFVIELQSNSSLLTHPTATIKACVKCHIVPSHFIGAFSLHTYAHVASSADAHVLTSLL